MTYTVNIVVNSRNWYDSRIAVNDPVVYQNINYTGASQDRSVSVVRQRFLQDWARRAIPNSVREGIGLTDPVGASDQIVVTQGYAFVAGRFLDIPAGSFDASTPLLATAFHYLVIAVEGGISPGIAEGDTRDPTAETAELIAMPFPYTKTHNELVIAKFYFDGTFIEQFEDYTAIQEWQASVISPVSVIPGLTTGSNSILLRAYESDTPEAVDVLSIEEDKTRFYLNAVFNDQVASTEFKLINKSGRLWSRDITDNAYLGQDMFDLHIGGAEFIDSSRNLIAIGDINTHTIQGGTDVFVMRNTADTLTSKILTSPDQTSGTLNSGDALTANSTEINQIITGRTRGGTSSGDIITIDNTQTMTNKTLTMPIIANIKSSAAFTHTLPDIPDDTIVLLNASQTMDAKSFTNFVLRDDDDSHAYSFITGTLTSPRSITIPDGSVLSVTPDENTMVFTETTQSMTNKTITSSTFGGSLTGSATLTSLIASNNLDIGNYELRARTFESDEPSAAPFIVNSTTMVTKLNAQYLGGADLNDAGTGLTDVWTASKIRDVALGDVSVSNATISFYYIDGGFRESVTVNNVAEAVNAGTVDGYDASALAKVVETNVLREYLCIGSSNYGYMPCVFIGREAANPDNMATGLQIANIYGGMYINQIMDRDLYYVIPLPYSLGGTDSSQKKLVIAEVQVKLATAHSVTGYINNVYITGVGDGSIYNTTIQTANIDDTSVEKITCNYTVATNTRILYVRLDALVSVPGTLMMDFVSVKYYYGSDTS